MRAGDGIFAGGDMIGGARTMTTAVGHGKKAARHIDAWLRGTVYEKPPLHPPIPYEQLNLTMFLDAERREHAHLPMEKRTGFDEVVAGLSEREARYEAMRCLSCGNCFECDNCVVYCPQTAVFRVKKNQSTTGRYVDTDYSKCIGCHICSDVCPTGYIQMGLGE